MPKMKTTFSVLLSGLCLAFLVSGCYSTVEGRNKAGVPWGKDRIESRYQRPADQVFESAKLVLMQIGTLQSENSVANTLEAKVDNNTVWVRVEEVQPGISQVTTQCRGKGGGAKVAIASEVDKRIALELTRAP